MKRTRVKTASLVVITVLSMFLVSGNIMALDWTYSYDPFDDASGGGTYEVYRMGYAFDDENLYFTMWTGLPQEGSHSGDHNFTITDATLDKVSSKGVSAEVITRLETLKDELYSAKWDLEDAMRGALGKWVTDGCYSTVKEYGYHYELTADAFATLESQGLSQDTIAALVGLQGQVWKNKTNFVYDVKQTVKDALGKYPSSGERKKISTAAYNTTVFSLTEKSFQIFNEKGIPEEFLAQLASIQDIVYSKKKDLERAIKTALGTYEKSGVKGVVAKYAQKEATMINAGDLYINVNGRLADSNASGEVFGLPLTSHAGDMNTDMLYTSSSYKSASKDDVYDWSAVTEGHLYSNALFSTGVYEGYKGAKAVDENGNQLDGGKDAFGDENNAPVHIAEFEADFGFQGNVDWAYLGKLDQNGDGKAKESTYEVNAVISLSALGVQLGDTIELGWSMECGNDFATISGTVPGSPVATPEPGTLLLLGAGLIGIIGFAKKKSA